MVTKLFCGHGSICIPLTDVGIIFYTLDRWGNPALLSEVEAAILRATEPLYNAQIPME